MVRGPLPDERLLAWPHSNPARDLLRFIAWAGAIVWFVAPPAILFHTLPALVAVPVSFVTWAGGFIVLGRLVRCLAPLPDEPIPGE